MLRQGIPYYLARWVNVTPFTEDMVGDMWQAAECRRDLTTQSEAPALTSNEQATITSDRAELAVNSRKVKSM